MHFDWKRNKDTTVVPFAAPSQDPSKEITAKLASSRSAGSKDAALGEKVPRNGHEFERELRRKPTAEEKVLLLEAMLDKDGLVAKLFGRELDGEMLRQILTALEEVILSGTGPQGVAR